VTNSLAMSIGSQRGATWAVSFFFLKSFTSETGSHCVAGAGLELRSSCFHLQSAGITGRYHHTRLLRSALELDSAFRALPPGPH
jgi:hypothetical protein